MILVVIAERDRRVVVIDLCLSRSGIVKSSLGTSVYRSGRLDGPTKADLPVAIVMRLSGVDRKAAQKALQSVGGVRDAIAFAKARASGAKA